MKRFIGIRMLALLLTALLALGCPQALASGYVRYHSYDYIIGSQQDFGAWAKQRIHLASNLQYTNNIGIHFYGETYLIAAPSGFSGAMGQLLDSYSFENAPEGSYTTERRIYHSEMGNLSLLYTLHFTLQKKHQVSVSHSGAPKGYGGVSGEPSSLLVSPGGSVTLTVQDVPGHTFSVSTTPSLSYSRSGNSYTFSNVRDNFSFDVTYTANEFAYVSFTQPAGASISVNNSSSSPVRVIRGIPYTVQVTASYGYALSEIRHNNAAQTISNIKTVSFTKTAQTAGVTDTVSASASPLSLEVRPTAEMEYHAGMSAKEVAEKVFEAIYVGSASALTKSSVSSSSFDKKPVKVSCYSSSASIFPWIPVVDDAHTECFSSAVPVTVRLEHDGQTSNECLLTLINPNIQLVRPIAREETGKPITFSWENNVDFEWSVPSGVTQSTVFPQAYYDANGEKLPSAPTQPGSYSVVLTLRERTNPLTALLPAYRFSRSALLPFTILPAEISEIKNISGGDKVYDGQPAALSFTITGKQNGSTREWTFTDGVCGDCPVSVSFSYQDASSGSGETFQPGMPVNAGSYRAKITAGNLSATTDVIISSKVLTDSMVSASPADAVYTGSAHDVSFTVKDGDNALVQGTDYALTASADLISAGSKTFTLSGLGNYAGTVSRSYTILQATPAAEHFVFTAPENPTYDGSPKTADVQLHSSAGSMGAFTVSYEDALGNQLSTPPVNAGTYTVKLDVAASENFTAASGIELGSFTILPAVPVAAHFECTLPANPVYDGSPKTADVQLRSSMSGMGAFTVSYEDALGNQLSTPPVNAGTYTVKLDVEASENYAAASGIELGSFTILPASPAAEHFVYTAPENLIYDGSPKTADVQLHSSVIGMGDFTVRYCDQNGNPASPVNAGAYTVMVDVEKGGNYEAVQGIRLGSFIILPASASVSIAPDQSAVYDGEPVTAGEQNADILYARTGDGDLTVRWYADENGTIGALLPSAPEAAGSYWIGVSAAASSNYGSADEVLAPFAITRRGVTPVSISGYYEKPYDGTTAIADTHGLMLTIQPIQQMDQVSATASFAFDSAEAGTTLVRATDITLVGADASNYVLTTDTLSGNVGLIVQAGTDLSTAATYKGNAPASSFTFGDTITVKAKPQSNAQPARKALFGSRQTDGDNTMALYWGSVLLTAPVGPDENGEFVAHYSTTDCVLPLGSFEIIVKFSGSGNLAAEQAILPVTLNAAELKLESAHGISRFYRKGDRSIEFDSFTISGYVPGFEDARLSLSGGTLSGQVKSAAPGRYTEAFFSEFPALTGRYADYYKLYAPLTAGTDVEIWSAPTVQPGPNSGQPGKQGYEKWGKTGAPVSFTVDADGNALSYQWYIVRDGIATALRDSDLYTGTNTPTLTIVRADPLMDGQRFLCVVTNPAGEAQIEFVLKLYAQAAIPQTGDSALPMLWIALMFMSLAGTTLLVRRREQR